MVPLSVFNTPESWLQKQNAWVIFSNLNHLWIFQLKDLHLPLYGSKAVKGEEEGDILCMVKLGCYVPDSIRRCRWRKSKLQPSCCLSFRHAALIYHLEWLKSRKRCHHYLSTWWWCLRQNVHKVNDKMQSPGVPASEVRYQLWMWIWKYQRSPLLHQGAKCCIQLQLNSGKTTLGRDVSCRKNFFPWDDWVETSLVGW